MDILWESKIRGEKMQNQNFTWKKIKKDQSGFTLVELIIAIGILAIISLPIYNYFTDAGKRNAESRTKQNATVQAQDILEVFKNCDYSLNDSSVVCANDTDATKWTVKDAQNIPGGKMDYTLQKTVQIDKSSFTVEAKIDPIQQVTESATNSSIIVDYQKSVVGTMDTNKDMMISENGQSLLAAKLYFYGKHADQCAKNKQSNPQVSPTEPTMTMDEMERNLHCTVLISAKEEKNKLGLSTGNVTMKAEYIYTFIPVGGYPAGIDATMEYRETVESSSLDPKEMKNIYLFYQPVTGSAVSVEDDVQLDADTFFNDTNHVANDQLKLFLIAQSSVAYNASEQPAGYSKRPLNYKLNLSDVSAGSYFKNKIGKVYTNLSRVGNELFAPSFDANQIAKDMSTPQEYTLVEHEEARRVAKITVKILKDGKEYASVDGTKIQN